MYEIIISDLAVILGAWLLLINAVGAITVIVDKYLSKKPRGSVRRVPEKRFVFLSMIGGGFGTLGAMLTVRHKTKSHDFLLFKILLFTCVWGAAILLFLKYF